MNKYQEALNTLTDWFHSYKNEKGITVHERHITPKYEDAKKTIQELVDKATPKKLESKTDKDGRLLWICPNCGDVYMKFWSDVETITCRKYCDECGQKLKWCEEDE